jgi:hypothetical protein
MRAIYAGNKQELVRQIECIEKDTKRLYINARPSMDIVQKIVDNAPNIEEILCPPSLLKQTSTKVFSVLESKGVKLAHKDVRIGRPNKYDEKVVSDIRGKRAAGTAVKEIAREMKIPLRTVYYYLKN